MEKGEGCLLVILMVVIFLLDTTRFTPELIPITCGALAVVGNYFKTSVTKSKE